MRHRVVILVGLLTVFVIAGLLFAKRSSD